MDDKKSLGTQETIRLAAIDLIESRGGARITTREIAAAAKVNVAAINYYFRSKDALLSEALRSSWSHAMEDLRAFLAGDPWDCRRGLESIAEYLLEGGARFPNITRAHLLGLEHSGEDETSGPAFVAAGIRQIIAETAERVGEALGLKTDETLTLRTASFFAALLYPAIIPSAFPPLTDHEALARYKTVLVQDFITSVRTGAR
jgi:AcrR family transcriptional regulator